MNEDSELNLIPCACGDPNCFLLKTRSDRRFKSVACRVRFHRKRKALFDFLSTRIHNVYDIHRISSLLITEAN